MKRTRVENTFPLESLKQQIISQIERGEVQFENALWMLKYQLLYRHGLITKDIHDALINICKNAAIKPEKKAHIIKLLETHTKQRSERPRTLHNPALNYHTKPINFENLLISFAFYYSDFALLEVLSELYFRDNTVISDDIDLNAFKAMPLNYKALMMVALDANSIVIALRSSLHQLDQEKIEQYALKIRQIDDVVKAQEVLGYVLERASLKFVLCNINSFRTLSIEDIIDMMIEKGRFDALMRFVFNGKIDYKLAHLLDQCNRLDLDALKSIFNVEIFQHSWELEDDDLLKPLAKVINKYQLIDPLDLFTTTCVDNLIENNAHYLLLEYVSNNHTYTAQLSPIILNNLDKLHQLYNKDEATILSTNTPLYCNYSWTSLTSHWVKYATISTEFISALETHLHKMHFILTRYNALKEALKANQDDMEFMAPDCFKPVLFKYTDISLNKQYINIHDFSKNRSLITSGFALLYKQLNLHYYGDEEHSMNAALIALAYGGIRVKIPKNSNIALIERVIMQDTSIRIDRSIFLPLAQSNLEIDKDNDKIVTDMVTKELCLIGRLRFVNKASYKSYVLVFNNMPIDLNRHISDHFAWLTFPGLKVSVYKAFALAQNLIESTFEKNSLAELEEAGLDTKAMFFSCVMAHISDAIRNLPKEEALIV